VPTCEPRIGANSGLYAFEKMYEDKLLSQNHDLHQAVLNPRLQGLKIFAVPPAASSGHRCSRPSSRRRPASIFRDLSELQPKCRGTVKSAGSSSRLPLTRCRSTCRKQPLGRLLAARQRQYLDKLPADVEAVISKTLLRRRSSSAPSFRAEQLAPGRAPKRRLQFNRCIPSPSASPRQADSTGVAGQYGADALVHLEN